ncbi:early activation antigen CD69-like [Heteronotia binoei]|uniref:early activation antigen CD69-like n=1 Tax=Heteronotia binoei TaxID=13085 RepID=UPI002931CE41|nr:early activation antigen CD69-like [Heteronotia binoei]
MTWEIPGDLGRERRSRAVSGFACKCPAPALFIRRRHFTCYVVSGGRAGEYIKETAVRRRGVWKCGPTRFAVERTEMVISMTCTIQPEVTEPLRVACPENDLSDPASEQMAPPHNEGSGRNKQNVGRCRLSKKKVIVITVIAAVSVSLVISVVYNFVGDAQRKQLEAEIKQLKVSSTSKPSLTTSCPRGWTWNAEYCYGFSDTDSTWDFAHSNCTSYGASMVVMDTPEEKAFINENKASAEYWIGLRREDIGKPWKQPDGLDFNDWFDIKGQGLCASLNDGVESSTDCDSQRRWICRKHLHTV